jgi:segregation and condensation protein B
MSDMEQYNDVNRTIGIIESILFASGDPLPIHQLQNILDLSEIETLALIEKMESEYENENRGIRLYVTDSTVQLTTKPEYADHVEKALQPLQSKSFSQAMLETLSVIAYKQPVTRSDVEAVRGVRCDYTVSQLQKLGFIQELGRKDSVGRPVLYGTTDAFLRQFGLRSIKELPNFEQFLQDEIKTGGEAE